MTLLDDLKSYYSNLLIFQYHNKPKAIATIKSTINVLLANLLLFAVRDCFNLETAVGVQLDIIGKYVGINRFYKAYRFDEEPFFALIPYDSTISDLQRGFSTYDNWGTTTGDSLQYSDLNPTVYVNQKMYHMLFKLCTT